MKSKTEAAGLTIRPFAPDDLSRLQEIRAAAFAPVFASFRQIVGEALAERAFAAADADQAAYLDRLCSPDSGFRFFVAAMGSETVGFVSVCLDARTKIGEIGLNAVHPSHAGQGIGTALYGFAVALMREKGMRVATASTGGDASHAPARRAYEKAGFEAGVPSIHLYRLLWMGFYAMPRGWDRAKAATTWASIWRNRA